MTSPWERFAWRGAPLPQATLEETLRESLELPRTLRPVQSPRAVQQAVFAPALKQHARAYRAVDPDFGDTDLDSTWRVARRQALDLVLGAIAATPWADGLVLRGSVLLRAWFGDLAREPGDLDFVVSPVERRIDDPWTAAMLTGVARAAQDAAAAQGGALRFRAEDAVDEPIWTYDRVPGRRLVLPWILPDAPELAGGGIQLDFVFNEHLPVAPEPLRIPPLGGHGPGAVLRAVTPELSLAWKLMWLLTDCYPQGKDLYDAVLLAEHTPLRHAILKAVFVDADPVEAARPLGVADIANLELGGEWLHFRAEYPDLPEDERALVARLAAATAPTFAAAEGLREDPGPS